MEKTREEIERALLAAVQVARAEYERTKANQTAAAHLSSDLESGNSDRTLALDCGTRVTAEATRALFQYREALRRFTDFVVSGKLPDDG